MAEDDRNFGLVLKSELEDEGYSVDLVDDGCEAVRNFVDRADEYDFAILDIKMPRLDGINALKIIKKFNPCVPAITISGNAGSLEMAESVNMGAMQCFTKPFEISRLKDTIRKTLEGDQQ